MPVPAAPKEKRNATSHSSFEQEIRLEPFLVASKWQALLHREIWTTSQDVM
jgi:hypothetical protein